MANIKRNVFFKIEESDYSKMTNLTGKVMEQKNSEQNTGELESYNVVFQTD